MDITIRINTDSDDLYDESVGYNEYSLARVLRELADKFEDGREPISIMDINGNKVGSLEYEG